MFNKLIGLQTYSIDELLEMNEAVEKEIIKRGYCPECGDTYGAHNDDGSCGK